MLQELFTDRDPGRVSVDKLEILTNCFRSSVVKIKNLVLKHVSIERLYLFRDFDFKFVIFFS